MSSDIPLLGSEAIAAAVRAGNVNIGSAVHVEVLDLNAESKAAQIEHAELLQR